jgi:putative ATP-dependent endonuclease of the OLD family
VLPKDDETLVRSKDVLRRLHSQHGIHWATTAFSSDKKTGWQAADTWAVFPQDLDGVQISAGLHDVLLEQRG